MKILLVTESPHQSELLIETLKTDGFLEVLLVDRLSDAELLLGPLGVDQLPEGEVDLPDLGLILINMHEHDSLAVEFLVSLKQTERYADIPVVLCGLVEDRDEMTRLFSAGAADYVRRGPGLAVEFPVRIMAAMHRRREMNGLLSRHRHLEETNSQLITASEIFRRISIRDPLTGIPNRRFFDRYLDIVWKQAMNSLQPVSLLLVDVDYFKLYNDTYGHRAGDDCLRSVATTLSSSLAGFGYIIARYGGEEFAAILPETDSARAVQLAEEIRRRVSELEIEHRAPDADGHVTISLGVATGVPGLLHSPTNLIEKADRALYRAKNDGRNRVVI